MRMSSSYIISVNQLSPNQYFFEIQAHDSHHLHLQDWRQQAGRG